MKLSVQVENAGEEALETLEELVQGSVETAEESADGGDASELLEVRQSRV